MINIHFGLNGRKELFVFDPLHFQMFQDFGYTRISTWHGIHNLSSMRRICLPINRGNSHWVLGVVDFVVKKFGIIDPYKRSNQALDDKLREWLLAVCEGQKMPIDILKWTKLTHSDIDFEFQDNSWDCGV